MRRARAPRPTGSSASTPRALRRCKARALGGTITLGRVQTPTLALIVRREQEIEAFEPVALLDRRGRVRARLRAARATSDAGSAAPRCASPTRPPPWRSPSACASARDASASCAPASSASSRRCCTTSPRSSARRRSGTASRRSARSRPRRSATRGRCSTYPAHREPVPVERPRRRAAGDRRARRRGLASTTSEPAAYVQGLDELPLARVVDDAKVTDHHALDPHERAARPRRARRRRPAHLRHGRAPLPGGVLPARRVRAHRP